MKINKVRLGVNIDHVATLRQARGEKYPCLKRATTDAIKAGAEQITIHLREDRRHIQDQDVFDVREVCSEKNTLLNLELACNDPSVLQTAINAGPDWVCIVPEKREEVTTEGGLNLLDEKTFIGVHNTSEQLRAKISNIKISLFLEADLNLVPKIIELRPDAVEVHTGKFAKLFLEKKSVVEELERFKAFSEELKKNNIKVHAGHGLTLEMIPQILEDKLFEELNIGHWIISESVFLGLENVVSEINSCIKKGIL
jgi:pyridoxine 5-phosphate synthase